MQFNSGPNSDETMDRNFQTENLAVNMGDAGRPQSQLGLASLWASAMGEPLSTTTNGPSVKRAPSSPSRPAPAKTHPPNNGFSTRATTAAVTTEVATQTGNSAAAIAGKRGTEGELVNPTAEINNDGTNEEGIDDPEQSAETLSRLATIQTEQKALAKRFSDVIVESAKSEWKKQKHAASVARKAWEEAGKVLKEAETQEELKREYWQAAEKYETSMGTTEQLYCVFKKAAEKLNK